MKHIPSLPHSWTEDDGTGFAEISMVEIKAKKTTKKTTKEVKEAIIQTQRSQTTDNLIEDYNVNETR